MSRVVFALAAGTLAAFFSLPVSAAQPSVNSFGLPVAPQGGNASIHQWGGVDDSFAVNPDGDEAPARSHHHAPSALAQNQQDSDDDDPGDPGPDDLEVLPI